MELGETTQHGLSSYFNAPRGRFTRNTARLKMERGRGGGRGRGPPQRGGRGEQGRAGGVGLKKL